MHTNMEGLGSVSYTYYVVKSGKANIFSHSHINKYQDQYNYLGV